MKDGLSQGPMQVVAMSKLPRNLRNASFELRPVQFCKLFVLVGSSINRSREARLPLINASTGDHTQLENRGTKKFESDRYPPVTVIIPCNYRGRNPQRRNLDTSWSKRPGGQ